MFEDCSAHLGSMQNKNIAELRPSGSLLAPKAQAARAYGTNSGAPPMTGIRKASCGSDLHSDASERSAGRDTNKGKSGSRDEEREME